MKRNMKFFAIVISLLLLSTIVLTGCMLAIAEDNGEVKSYDLNGQKYNSDDDGGNTPGHIIEDAPLPQESLQAKFESMYEISEDGKSITVISADYLNKYWQSNYEKEVIKSLSTEEIYFIIQDSIRIYEEYDEVVLTAFGSVSSTMQVAKRFPLIKDDAVINTGFTDSNYCFYLEEDISNIYNIIMYRLTALSSPKAFITGEEAIRFVGKEPGIFSSMLPWTTFYIPNYSESTDRDYILQTVGYSVNSNSNYVDVDKFSDLFCFCDKSGVSITFEAKANRQSTKVYPTLEMEKQMGNVSYVAVNGTFFRLYRGGYFSMSQGKYASVALTGKYILKDDVLTLILTDDHQYDFYYVENEGYLYKSDSSTPFEVLFGVDNNTMFYEEDH